MTHEDEPVCSSCGGTGTKFYGHEHSTDPCECQLTEEQLLHYQIELMLYEFASTVDADYPTEQIIALVRADERRRLREALLSDEAIDAASSEIMHAHSLPESELEASIDAATDAVSAALAAIGLGEQEVE